MYYFDQFKMFNYPKNNFFSCFFFSLYLNKYNIFLFLFDYLLLIYIYLKLFGSDFPIILEEFDTAKIINS
jgi:hypothetical protein